jgi:hypothetical protein
MKKYLMVIVLCFSLLVAGGLSAAVEIGGSVGWNYPLEDLDEYWDKGGFSLELRAGTSQNPVDFGFLSGYLAYAGREELSGSAKVSWGLIPLIGYARINMGPLYAMAGGGAYITYRKLSLLGQTDDDSRTDPGLMAGLGFRAGLETLELDFGLRYHLLFVEGETLGNIAVMAGVNFKL